MRLSFGYYKMELNIWRRQRNNLELWHRQKLELDLKYQHCIAVMKGSNIETRLRNGHTVELGNLHFGTVEQGNLLINFLEQVYQFKEVDWGHQGNIWNIFTLEPRCLARHLYVELNIIIDPWIIGQLKLVVVDRGITWRSKNIIYITNSHYYTCLIFFKSLNFKNNPKFSLSS